MAVEVESGAGRRLCVFRDGLCGGVARLFKRIVAGDGLGVAVKELGLAVDVQPVVGFRMLVALDAVGFALPLVDLGFCWKSETDGIHSYQHPETHHWLHIDNQGQFFDRHAQPITRESALEQAGHSLTQSVAENAQSPTGSGLNLNGHGISL